MVSSFVFCCSIHPCQGGLLQKSLFQTLFGFRGTHCQMLFAVVLLLHDLFAVLLRHLAAVNVSLVFLCPIISSSCPSCHDSSFNFGWSTAMPILIVCLENGSVLRDPPKNEKIVPSVPYQTFFGFLSSNKTTSLVLKGLLAMACGTLLANRDGTCHETGATRPGTLWKIPWNRWNATESP